MQKKIEIDKKKIDQNNKFESLDTAKIKPKLKPKPEQSTSKKINTVNKIRIGASVIIKTILVIISKRRLILN